MSNKDVVLALTIVLLIFALLLAVIVINVAIFFQNLRKKIETKIYSTEKVAKMTVKPKRKQNKYSKSRKRKDEGVTEFYDAPQMTDRHREAMKKKAAQQQGVNDEEYEVSLEERRNIRRGSKAMLTPESKDSYIVCIGEEESTEGRLSQLPEKSKTRGQTSARTKEDDGSYIECIRGEKHVMQSFNPSAATLPVHALSPFKEDFGRAFKGSPRGKVMQQKTSHRSNRPVKSNDTPLNAQEMYEIMINKDEIYENSAYLSDSNEELYGNQEMVEQEKRRVSQGNAKHFVQELSTTWKRDSKKENEYQNSFEEEVYENQEIVDRERNKRAKFVNDNYFSTMVGHANPTNSKSAECIELYENYIQEETYENC